MQQQTKFQMQIVTLEILNFMGIEKQKISFEHVTNIYGANRSGKSSIVDAISWLLTGKNAQDKEKFDIKNTKKPKLNRGEHKVIGTYIINGAEVVLSACYMENWVKPKGSETAELKGHVTKYEINGVPKSQTEYFDYIKSVVPLDIFKMITNPSYFPNMEWKDQRNLVMSMAGDIDDTLILDSLINVSNKGSYLGLINALNDTTSAKNQRVSNYKKKLAAEIAKIKEEVASIPHKIQEAIGLRPVTVNIADIDAEVKRLEAEIADIDNAINSNSKSNEAEQLKVESIKKQIREIKAANNDIEFKAQTTFRNSQFTRDDAVAGLRNSQRTATNNLQFKKDEIAILQDGLNQTVTAKEAKLKEWYEVNEKELAPFHEDKFNCPACKRPLPDDEISSRKATIVSNFNTNKQTRLDIISDEGKRLMSSVDNYNEKIKAAQAELADLEQALKSANALLELKLSETLETLPTVAEILAADVNYKSNQETIEQLEQSLTNRPGYDTPGDGSLAEQKRALNVELDAVKAKRLNNDRAEQIDKRVEELKAKEKQLNSDIASLQQSEFATQKFIVAKVDAIQERVKSLFKNVTFEMFERTLAGSIAEKCELIFDDVRYKSLNTESKLNAGLDIINAINSFYNTSAPIFIDNRESVSEILPVNAQVVNLFVSEKDKKLRIA